MLSHWIVQLLNKCRKFKKKSDWMKQFQWKTRNFASEKTEKPKKKVLQIYVDVITMLQCVDLWLDSACQYSLYSFMCNNCSAEVYWSCLHFGLFPFRKPQISNAISNIINYLIELHRTDLVVLKLFIRYMYYLRIIQRLKLTRL